MLPATTEQVPTGTRTETSAGAVKKNECCQLLEASCRQAVDALHRGALGNDSVSVPIVFPNDRVGCNVKGLT